MSKVTYPSKLPASMKAAAQFFERRGRGASPTDLLSFLDRAPDEPPATADR